jgi:hypothetical protein
MSLTGSELVEIVSPLATPLPPDRRGDFFIAVEDALRAWPEAAHGPGLVHRIAVGLQRDFYTPAKPRPAPQYFNSRKQPRDR